MRLTKFVNPNRRATSAFVVRDSRLTKFVNPNRRTTCAFVIGLVHFIPTALGQQPSCTTAALAGAEVWHAVEELRKCKPQTSIPNSNEFENSPSMRQSCITPILAHQPPATDQVIES
jgi:hypothetical protein